MTIPSDSELEANMSSVTTADSRMSMIPGLDGDLPSERESLPDSLTTKKIVSVINPSASLQDSDDKDVNSKEQQSAEVGSQSDNAVRGDRSSKPTIVSSRVNHANTSY